MLGTLGWTQSQSQKTLPAPSTKLIYSIKGPELYRTHCAACHGTGGKGNGPVAPVLKVKIQGLTTIAARNGGKFPAERVRRIISGEVTWRHTGHAKCPSGDPCSIKWKKTRTGANHA